MEHTPRRHFRCGYGDHLIDKCPKPPKDNEKRQKKVFFIEKGNHTYHKECENGKNGNDQKIYAYMERISGNDESPSRYFSDSSQLTNWILDSGSTCHITSQVSDFISVS